MPTVAIVGLQPQEAEWVRILLDLLRDEDPAVVEMVRHALLYVREFAQQTVEKEAGGSGR